MKSVIHPKISCKVSVNSHIHNYLSYSAIINSVINPNNTFNYSSTIDPAILLFNLVYVCICMRVFLCVCFYVCECVWVCLCLSARVRVCLCLHARLCMLTRPSTKCFSLLLSLCDFIWTFLNEKISIISPQADTTKCWEFSTGNTHSHTTTSSTV